MQSYKRITIEDGYFGDLKQDSYIEKAVNEKIRI